LLTDRWSGGSGAHGLHPDSISIMLYGVSEEAVDT